MDVKPRDPSLTVTGRPARKVSTARGDPVQSLYSQAEASCVQHIRQMDTKAGRLIPFPLPKGTLETPPV